MTAPTPRADDEKRSDMNADMRRRAAEIPPWLKGECDPTPAEAAGWIVSLWGDLDADQPVRQRGQKGTAAFVARAYLDGRGELARLRAALSRIVSDQPYLVQTCITEVTDEQLNRVNEAQIMRAIARDALAGRAAGGE